MESQSPEIDKLCASILAAQMQMQPVKKDSTNPFFHSKYADLPAIWEALHPFRAEGITITQSPAESSDGHIALETQLTHTSGQWMRSRLKMRVAKDDPQGYGSAITYARRYALGAMTGLVTEEDDDGNAATTSNARQQTSGSSAKTRPGQAAADGTNVKSDVPKQATLAPVGAWVVPFGKHKGQPIRDVSDEDVDYLMRYYNGKLHDPANATSRYRDEWENAILEIRAELLTRYPESQT